jgi:hypothetical protein
MTNVNIDRNDNNNISVWTAEILQGPSAGLWNVFCKIDGLIHVRMDFKVSKYDAEGMRYAIQTSDGIANTNRWKCMQFKAVEEAPVLQAAVDLMESGKVNAHALKGDVFAAVGGEIHIFTGEIKGTPRALAAAVRKAGKITLAHWAIN